MGGRRVLGCRDASLQQNSAVGGAPPQGRRILKMLDSIVLSKKQMDA